MWKRESVALCPSCCLINDILTIIGELNSKYTKKI